MSAAAFLLLLAQLAAPGSSGGELHGGEFFLAFLRGGAVAKGGADVLLEAPRSGHRSGGGDVWALPVLRGGSGGHAAFPPTARWCIGLLKLPRDAGAGPGGAERLAAARREASDWAWLCHASTGPLHGEDGIWLRDMPPASYELWAFLVDDAYELPRESGGGGGGGGGAAAAAGAFVLGVFPRGGGEEGEEGGGGGVRVEVLDPGPVTRDFHLWYVDNVGMPGMGHPAFLGVPVQKSLTDLWTYGELLWELRPRLVVETGTLHGGSALHMAHTLRSVFAEARLDSMEAGGGAVAAAAAAAAASAAAAAGDGDGDGDGGGGGDGVGNGVGVGDGDGALSFHILTVDIDRSRVHKRALRDPAIEVLTASSTSAAAAQRYTELLAAPGRRASSGPALVLLDSLHTAAHVEAELALLAPLMRPGDYLIVEDTHHHHHPVPYSDGNGPGPYEAVLAFEAAHVGWFEHDTPRETKFGFTWNPNGYMVRTNVTAVAARGEACAAGEAC